MRMPFLQSIKTIITLDNKQKGNWNINVSIRLEVFPTYQFDIHSISWITFSFFRFEASHLDIPVEYRCGYGASDFTCACTSNQWIRMAADLQATRSHSNRQSSLSIVCSLFFSFLLSCLVYFIPSSWLLLPSSFLLSPSFGGKPCYCLGVLFSSIDVAILLHSFEVHKWNLLYRFRFHLGR